MNDEKQPIMENNNTINKRKKQAYNKIVRMIDDIDVEIEKTDSGFEYVIKHIDALLNYIDAYCNMFNIKESERKAIIDHLYGRAEVIFENKLNKYLEDGNNGTKSNKGEI